MHRRACAAGGAGDRSPPPGWDAKTRRLAVTGYGDVHRLYMLTLDQSNGAIKVDTAFHDSQGQPGFNFDNREWPHGWKGSANAHGVVFSR